MQISWDLYRFILFLDRHGTLSATSKAIGVNQSTASRRLKELEKSIGIQLFRLEDRRYHVTTQGLRWVKMAEAMEQAFVSSSLPISTAKRPSIRVTTLEFLLNSFILPHWSDFGFDPELHYEFETSSRRQDLKSTRFDFALRFSRPEHLGPLRIRKVATVSIGRVGLRGKPESQMGWVELEDEMQSLPEQKAGRPFREGRRVLQVSSYLSVLESIRTGHFMGMLPHLYLKQNPGLKLLAPAASIKREVWALMRESYTADPHLREFLKRLSQGFKGFGSELVNCSKA